MRIVLDTNVLLQALPAKSIYRPIFDAIRFRQIELAVSTAILLEYAEILSRRTSPVVAQNVLALLLGPVVARQQSIYFMFRLIPTDPDDNKFVDCAIACQADYLVTNDAHFRVLEQVKFPIIKLLTAQELLAVLKQP
jgi:putative PIN family toxin of toxin-antitoxin system